MKREMREVTTIPILYCGKIPQYWQNLLFITLGTVFAT